MLQKTKRCGDFEDSYMLVTDSQEIDHIMQNYVQLEDRDDFGSLFVRVGDAEYTECWGSEHSVPWRDIVYYWVPLAF